MAAPTTIAAIHEQVSLLPTVTMARLLIQNSALQVAKGKAAAAEKDAIRRSTNMFSMPSGNPEIAAEVKSLLNRLTMERFDSISDQIIGWVNKSEKEEDGRGCLGHDHRREGERRETS